MNGFKEWWASASPRDQMALVLCSLFVGVYILFKGILGPVVDMRDAQINKNNAQLASLARVKVLAAEVKSLQSSGAQNTSKRSVESIVQSSISRNRLNVSSMDASGQNGVRVRFEEVPFNTLLTWLHEMEITNGLNVKDLSVAKGSNSGMVTVNLRLHQS